MEQRTTEWLEEQTNAVNTDVLRVFVAFKDATATELARRDVKKQSLTDRITDLVIKNAQLVQEVNKLKDQLSDTKLQAASSDSKNEESKRTQDDTLVEGKPVPYQDFANLASRLEELRTRNLETEKSHADFVIYHEKMKEKYRKGRDHVNQWKAYTEKVSEELDTLRAYKRSHMISTTSKPNSASSHARTSMLKMPANLTPQATPWDLDSSPAPVPLNGSDRLQSIDGLPDNSTLAEPDQQPDSSTTLVSVENLPSSSQPREPVWELFAIPESAQDDAANAHEDPGTDARIAEMQQYIIANWGALRIRDKKRAKEIVQRGDFTAGRGLELGRLPVEHLEELYALVQEVVRRGTEDNVFDISSDIPLISGTSTTGDLPTIPGVLHGRHPPNPTNTHKDEGIGIMDFGYDSSSVHRPRISQKIPSSQTTEDDAAAEESTTGTLPKEESDDDDLPVVVSARSLKRKRSGPNAVSAPNDNQRQDGVSAIPIPVKDEPHSSPPPFPRSPRRLLDRTETLDLDELGVRIATPRKIQPRIDHRPTKEDIRSLALQKLRNERYTSEPAVKDEPEGSLRPYVRPFEVALDLTSIEDVDESPEDRANSAPAHVKQLGFVDTASGVLNPLDPNSMILPRAGGQEPSRKRRRKDEEQHFQNAQVSKSETHDHGREHIMDRIRRQLQSGVDTTVRTPARKSDSRTPLQNPTPPTTGKSRSSLPRTSAQATPTTKAGSRHSLKESLSRPGFRSTHTPLRNRPITQLTIDHFKPNPAYNQGRDYAFVETVRGRDARKCLPGCTKPECCGSAFRALAKAAPTIAAPRDLFDADDEDDEARLLQNHLGGLYDAAKIRRMPVAEKDELILQARMKLMADRHGRHKQAYERRATPPGFWRTDFPSTQETEKDREKARKLDRAMVEERWREAMREGGRWIFRDEKGGKESGTAGTANICYGTTA